MTCLRPLLLVALTAMLFGCFGCEGRTEILPNSERALRKTPPEFAADAAKRFPYKADAPHAGQAVGRAQVGYSVNKLEIANLGDSDWDDAEIWINKSYVVYLPKVKARAGKVTAIPFRDFYDQDGRYFPEDNRKTLVNTVAVYTGGKMWDVKLQLAD